MTTLHRHIPTLLLLFCCAWIAPAQRSLQAQPIEPSSPASSGTEFLVSHPHIAFANTQFLRLSIAAVQSARVTVTLLDDGSTTVRQVEAGTPWELDISRFRIGTEEPKEMTTLRVVAISSTAPIVVHAIADGEYFADAWNVLPVSELGVDYRVPSYPDQFDRGGFAQVIAVEDETEVRITPTALTDAGNSPGFTYSVTLDRGEAYQIVTRVETGRDMTGTRIRSDKPVAVIAGHQGTKIIREATNPLFEMPPSVSDLGRTYYGAPFTGRDTGYYRVIAVENGTAVALDGTPVTTLAAGEHVDLAAAGGATITGSRPILAVQFITHDLSVPPMESADPSMTLLLPETSWDSSFIWVAPDLRPRASSGTDAAVFTHYVRIVAPVDTRGPVLLDGVDVAAGLTTLHSDGRMRSGIVRIAPGEHRLQGRVPMDATIFGYTSFDAYSAPAGFRLRSPLAADPMTVRTCRSSLDTAIAIANVRGDTLELLEAIFEEAAGEVIGPSLPTRLAPFSQGALRIRIPLPEIGTKSGRLLLRYRIGGRIRETTIPIETQRDGLAVAIPASEILFPDAVGAAPFRDTTIVLVNAGEAPLRIDRGTIAEPFALLSPALPYDLAPGDSVRVTIRFSPQAPGDFAGELRLATLPCDLDLAIGLRGRRTTPATIDVAADTGLRLACDETTGEFDVVVTNRGGEEARLTGAGFDGPAAGDFAVLDLSPPRTVGAGESITLRVRFAPSEAGERAAFIRIDHEVPGGSTVAPVAAIRDSVAFTVADSLLTFDGTLACDSSRLSTTLRNTGSAPITLMSVLRNGGRDFTVETGLSGELMPGDSFELSLLFHPNETGIAADTLVLIGAPCGDSLPIVLSGLGTRPELRPSVDRIDFGTLPLCAADSTAEITIENTGNAPARITEIAVEGNGFAVIALSDSTLAPGEGATLTLRSDGDVAGAFSGEVVIRGEECLAEQRVVVSGNVVDAPIPVVADVAFENLPAGTPIHATATITNDGALPVRLDSLVVEPPVVGLVLVAPSPATEIPPGGSIELLFEYLSDAPLSFDADATLYFGSPCSSRSSFSITGRRERTTFRLVLPDTGAEVDRHIGLPIVLESGGYRGRVSIEAEARWDYRNLLVHGTSSIAEGGKFAIEENRIIGDERVLRFRYDGPAPAEGTLALLDALVLLGGTAETPLRITSLELASLDPETDATLEGRDGFFHTLGICTIDGERLVRLGSWASVGKVRPNPASSILEIPTVTGEAATATVTLRSPIGAKLLSSRHDVPAGESVLLIDVSQLPQGTVLLEIAIAGTTFRQIALIRR